MMCQLALRLLYSFDTDLWRRAMKSFGAPADNVVKNLLNKKLKYNEKKNVISKDVSEKMKYISIYIM